MTFYAEAEVMVSFDFDWEEIFHQVAEEVLNEENCPYETEVSLLITDNDGIQEFNRENRGIDKPTDVLSFPNVEFPSPADFSEVELHEADCFEPDSGELILGDIVINVNRVKEQAVAYGHSEKREFAFLVAHSMLHLCGYDHERLDQEAVMMTRQETILNHLNITRE